jgi:hypothetical protein
VDSVARTNTERDLDAVFADRARMEATLTRAVRAALVRHKRLGESIAVWRDGRVVEIPPEQIPEYDESK